MKPEQVKSRLERQLEEATARREQQIDATCQHEWKKYKQTLPIDHLNFKKTTAYFVISGCERCHAKVLMDYRME